MKRVSCRTLIDTSSMDTVCVLVLILLAKFVYSQDLPESIKTTVSSGSSASFSCTVSDVTQTIWLFRTADERDRAIAQNLEVYDAFKSQYSQQSIDYGNTTKLNLTVLSASKDGIYTCQEGSNTKLIAHLAVEVPPMVHLEMNEVMLTDVTDVVFLEEVSIQCVAKGGKPSVSLSWLVNGKSKTSGVTTDLSQEQDRIINSTLHYIPNKVDTNVTCVTSGQKIVPSISVNIGVNVRYKPDCTLLVTKETSNQFRLSCKCLANPEANGYKIFVNGSLYREQMEVLISSNDTSVVACSASNIIGEDKTEEQKLEPFHIPQPPSTARVALFVALPAVVICVIILGILAVVYIRARKAQKDKTDTENSVKAFCHYPPPPEENEGDTQETTPMQS